VGFVSLIPFVETWWPSAACIRLTPDAMNNFVHAPVWVCFLILDTSLRIYGEAKLQPHQLGVRRFIMRSEAIVVLVIVAFAVLGMFYLERNSRKNRNDNDE